MIPKQTTCHNSLEHGTYFEGRLLTLFVGRVNCCFVFGLAAFWIPGVPPSHIFLFFFFNWKDQDSKTKTMSCSLVKGVISSRFSQFGLYKVWSNPSTWSSWTWTSASCWRDSAGLRQALGFSTRCLNCRGMSALKWQQTPHLRIISQHF